MREIRIDFLRNPKFGDDVSFFSWPEIINYLIFVVLAGGGGIFCSRASGGSDFEVRDGTLFSWGEVSCDDGSLSHERASRWSAAVGRRLGFARFPARVGRAGKVSRCPRAGR
ncbi:hypothetical protein NL676_015171 [Syzygium grande]|nr:hypothetical protein NL676_015171 [Syzygium grande]